MLRNAPGDRGKSAFNSLATIHHPGGASRERQATCSEDGVNGTKLLQAMSPSRAKAVEGSQRLHADEFKKGPITILKRNGRKEMKSTALHETHIPQNAWHQREEHPAQLGDTSSSKLSATSKSKPTSNAQAAVGQDMKSACAPQQEADLPSGGAQISKPSTWAAILGTGHNDATINPSPRVLRKPTAPPMTLKPEEELRRQAHLSRIDPATGKLHCLACRKALPSYPALMQHLKQKHRGVNSIEARFFDDDEHEPTPSQQHHRSKPAPRVAVSLLDWMSSSTSIQAQATKKNISPLATTTHKDECLKGKKKQEFLNSGQELAQKRGYDKDRIHHASHNHSRTLLASELGGAGIGLGGGLGNTGRLVLKGAKKKKPSRLKRIILRERADLGLASARQLVEKAQGKAKAIMSAAVALREELDAAINAATRLRDELHHENLSQNQQNGGVLLPDMYTRVQFLEVSVQQSDKALALAEEAVLSAQHQFEEAEKKHRQAYKIPEVHKTDASERMKSNSEEMCEDNIDSVEVKQDEALGLHSSIKDGSFQQQECDSQSIPDSRSIRPELVVGAGKSNVSQEGLLPGEAPIRKQEKSKPALLPNFLSYAIGDLAISSSDTSDDDDDGDDDGVALPGFENTLSTWMSTVPKFQASVHCHKNSQKRFHGHPKPMTLSSAAILHGKADVRQSAADESCKIPGVHSQNSVHKTDHVESLFTGQQPNDGAQGIYSISNGTGNSLMNTGDSSMQFQPEDDVTSDSDSDRSDELGNGFTDVLSAWISQSSTGLGTFGKSAAAKHGTHSLPGSSFMPDCYARHDKSQKPASTMTKDGPSGPLNITFHAGKHPVSHQARDLPVSLAGTTAVSQVKMKFIEPQQHELSSHHATKIGLSTTADSVSLSSSKCSSNTSHQSKCDGGSLGNTSSVKSLSESGSHPVVQPGPNVLNKSDHGLSVGSPPPSAAWAAGTMFSDVVKGTLTKNGDAVKVEDGQADNGPFTDSQNCCNSQDNSAFPEADSKEVKTLNCGVKENSKSTGLTQPCIAERFGLVEDISALAPRSNHSNKSDYGNNAWHITETRSQKGTQIFCSICRVNVSGMEAFRQHCAGKRHLHKLHSQAKETLEQEADACYAGVDVASNDTLTETTQCAADCNSMALNHKLGRKMPANTNVTYVGENATLGSYCNQMISSDLNDVVVDLISQLRTFQARALAKGKKKKRLVAGLHEVAKAVKLRKAHSVIIVPNIECISSEGGLDERLHNLLTLAEGNETHVVYALSLKKLGQVFGQRKKISAVALLDVDGATQQAQEMLRLAALGKEAWSNRQQQATNRSSNCAPLPDIASQRQTLNHDGRLCTASNSEDDACVLEVTARGLSISPWQTGAKTDKNDTRFGQTNADKKQQQFQPGSSRLQIQSPFSSSSLRPTACAFFPMGHGYQHQEHGGN